MVVPAAVLMVAGRNLMLFVPAIPVRLMVMHVLDLLGLVDLLSLHLL